MDCVYVVYLNGKVYNYTNKKGCYFQKQYAKQVISAESRNIAEGEMRRNNGKQFYELSKDDQKKRIGEVKSRFEIKIFIEED